MSRSFGLRPVRRSGQLAEREPAAVRPPDASGRVGTGRCASLSLEGRSSRVAGERTLAKDAAAYSCSCSMVDLELTRVSGDRRLYELEDVGSLRLQGFFSRSAVAEAGERSWRLASSGLWGRRIEATDAAGVVAGVFEPRSFRRGGALLWFGREFALRPASSWRERYALADGDRELALLDGKGWGRRPVKVTVGDPDAVDAGLLLFAAFIVRRLAEDAGATAGAASSTAAASS